MNCPNCKKKSRCGCNSCKSRVKYPVNRAEKITGHHLGVMQCPYCRQRYTEDFLTDIEWKAYQSLKNNN